MNARATDPHPGPRGLGTILMRVSSLVLFLLVEAAWHYMGSRAHAGPTLARRREEVPPEMVAIADRALRRLRKNPAIAGYVLKSLLQGRS